MNAPFPVLTSNTIASAPIAIFLLIILLAINEIELIVPVASRNAYIFLSAGTNFPLCPTNAILCALTWLINCSFVSSTLKPCIDSNLSIVPPVCPKPLPDILATGTPKEATNGATIKLILSPTPPVECLSTFTPSIFDKSIVSPELIMALVKAEISSLDIPLK